MLNTTAETGSISQSFLLGTSLSDVDRAIQEKKQSGGTRDDLACLYRQKDALIVGLLRLRNEGDKSIAVGVTSPDGLAEELDRFSQHRIILCIYNSPNHRAAAPSCKINTNLKVLQESCPDTVELIGKPEVRSLEGIEYSYKRWGREFNTICAVRDKAAGKEERRELERLRILRAERLFRLRARRGAGRGIFWVTYHGDLGDRTVEDRISVNFSHDGGGVGFDIMRRQLLQVPKLVELVDESGYNRVISP